MVFDTEGSLELDTSDYIASAEDAADATDEFGESADETQESLFGFDAAGAAASAGIAAAGGAMNEAVDRSQDWRSELARVAESTDMTHEETEDLAKSVSDATFPMDDAVNTLSVLQQAGVDNQERMADLANEFDAVGDATGATAEEITDAAVPAIRLLEGDLEDAEDHMDALTFVANNTTQEVSDFTGVIERVGPQMRDMNMSMDEAAALIATLEDEGLTGRQAIQQLRSAMNNAEDGIGDVTEELDLNEDAFQKQLQAVEESDGLTQDLASAQNETITTTDRFSAALDDVVLSAGSLLEPIDALGPLLLGLGGAGMFVSTVNMSAVVPSLGAVLGALTPLLPVLLPLIAASGALYLAWESNFLGIRDVVGETVEWLTESITQFVEWLRPTIFETGEQLEQSFLQTWTSIQETVLEPFLEWATEAFEAFTAWLFGLWDEHFDDLAAEFMETWSFIREAILAPFLEWATEALSTFTEWLLEVFDATLNILQSAWGLWGENVTEILTALFGLLRGTIENWITIVTELFSAFFALLRGDWEGFAESILTIGTALFDQLRLFISTWITVITEAFGAFFAGVGAAWGAFKSATIGIVRELVNGVIGWFQSLFDRLVGNSVIPDLIERIIGAFSALANWVKIVWDIPEAMSLVFKRVVGAAMGSVTDMIEKATNALRDFATSIAPGWASDAVSSFRRVFNNAVPSSISLPSVRISNPLPGESGWTVGGGSLDLPQLDVGGHIQGPGFAMLHEGEDVLPAADVDRGNPKSSVDSGGPLVHIEQLIADNPRSAARELKRQMKANNLDRSA